jgi:Aldo/keto reductase family
LAAAALSWQRTFQLLETAMKQRVLGRSGLATSPVGLGRTSLSDAYGPADEAESVRTIHRALDLGVTLLDTGSSYGDGENERLVGRIGAMAELAAAARTGRNPLGRGEVWGYGRAMAEWWSIEVFDGAFPARPWKDAHSSSLIESAISNGAVDWVWHEHRWGVVLEVAFERDEQWEAYRDLPSVRAALDAVPDPINGLLVYRGRGGGAGAPSRRRPKPFTGAGAVELPEPEPEPLESVAGPEAPIIPR